MEGNLRPFVYSSYPQLAESFALCSVFFTRRRKHVVYHRTLRPGGKTMFDISRRTPEITGLNLDFLAALKPHTGATETESPLFLRMRVHFTRHVCRDTHNRNHCLITSEYSRI